MNRKVLLAALSVALLSGSLIVLPATTVRASGSTVSISPTSLAFGVVAYQATSAAQTVTVTNTGGSSVTFQRAHIGGANPSDFAKQQDTCSFGVLSPAQSCHVQVAFVPRAYPFGSRSASLTFADDAVTTPQIVALTGTSAFDASIRHTLVPSILPCCAVTDTLVQSVSRGPGADTNIWITEVGQGALGQIPSGGGGFITQFSLPGTGSQPYGLTRGPASDTTELFFTDQAGSGRLWKFSVSTNAFTSLVTFATAGSNPGNITLGPDGNIWGVETGANQLFRYTLPSGPLTEFASGVPAASGLTGISRGPSGDTNLYFTMATANKVGKITTGATPAISVLAATLPTGSSPNSLVAGPDAKLWVTLAGGASVVQVDPATGALLATKNLPTTASHPMGIASDGTNLWVTNAGKLSRIKFVSNAFNSISDIPMPASFSLPSPQLGSVAVDAAGNPWFADSYGFGPSYTVGSVDEYSLKGAPSTFGLPAVQFGNQALNTYSGDYFANLSNGGTNDLHVTATTFGGPDAGSFHLSSNPCLGHAVTPFGSCSYRVNFSPATGIHAYSATLTFTLTNQFGSAIPAVVETLSGSGTAQAPITDFPLMASAFTPFCPGACGSSNLLAPGPSSIVVAEPNANRVALMTTGATPTLSQWVVPTGDAAPVSIAWDGATPGNLWFTESAAGQIGRLNLSTHVFTEFPLPTSGAMPTAIVYDPSNHLMYFTASSQEGAFIDSISSTGVITEHLDVSAGNLGRVIVGGDGNIWAEEPFSSFVDRMTPAGAITQVFVSGGTGNGIAAGPLVGGKPTIWVASGLQIGYVTTDGVSSASFTVPVNIGGLAGLTHGAGNTMYVTMVSQYINNDANKVAKVTLSGTTIGGFLDQSLPHEDSGPSGVTIGADGNLWILEQKVGALGREAPF